MITNAETLKEIQKGAVMNAFKKNCINDWLHAHNPSPSTFANAVNAFTRSCAAYSVGNKRISSRVQFGSTVVPVSICLN